MSRTWWVGVASGILAIALVAVTTPSAKSLFQSRFGRLPDKSGIESTESRNTPQIQNPDTEVVPANLPITTPKSTAKPVYVTPKPTTTTSSSTAPKPVNSPAFTTMPVATSTPTPKPTPTPTPIPDTQPPVFEYMTGPEDGSTVTFNGFCFPMRLTDNFPGTISVRYSFDASGPSEWGQNYAPCYQNVANGFHVFVVQGRDSAGNETGHITRNFTVQVAN